jgi:hypothetical protein
MVEGRRMDQRRRPFGWSRATGRRWLEGAQLGVRLWPCGCGKLREAAPSSPGTHEPTLRNRGWQAWPEAGAGAAGRSSRGSRDHVRRAVTGGRGHDGTGAQKHRRGRDRQPRGMQRFAREASGFQRRRAAAGRFPSSGRRGLFRSAAVKSAVGDAVGSCASGVPMPASDAATGRDLRGCYELFQPSAAAAIPQSGAAVAAVAAIYSHTHPHTHITLTVTLHSHRVSPVA